SPSRYNISNRSWGQPSLLSLFSMRQAITWTGICSLHILSFRHRQWFGSVFSGSSICSLQVPHTIRWASSPLFFTGWTSNTLNFSVLAHSSHWLLLLFPNSFSIFIYNLLFLSR